MSFRLRKPWAVLICSAICFFISNSAIAQRSRHERVDYYRSPFQYAAQGDPLGAILKRLAARFEYRSDPLYSRYFEVEYHLDLRGFGKSGDPMRAGSIAYGTRIYLRDNAAMEGLFAGANLGVSLISGITFGARIGMEVGYKIRLGKSQFFMEPEVLIEAYVLKRPTGKIVLPYVAVPFGVFF
jgi:hypothetical protein